jgi:ribosome-associated toxin RatA of RatAB toxin-antitoxin module
MGVAKADQEKTFDVSADKYFQAVSDYEKYPQFVEGMKKVKAERNGSEVTAHYELSMMGKDLSYSLKVREDPAKKTVDWSLLKSDFFTINNGAWKIESTGPNSCKVRYGVEVEFNFPVPGFILKGIVKSQLPTMMDGFYKQAKKL